MCVCVCVCVCVRACVCVCVYVCVCVCVWKKKTRASGQKVGKVFNPVMKLVLENQPFLMPELAEKPSLHVGGCTQTKNVVWCCVRRPCLLTCACVVDRSSCFVTCFDSFEKQLCM